MSYRSTPRMRSETAFDSLTRATNGAQTGAPPPIRGGRLEGTGMDQLLRSGDRDTPRVHSENEAQDMETDRLIRLMPPKIQDKSWRTWLKQSSKSETSVVGKKLTKPYQ